MGVRKRVESFTSWWTFGLFPVFGILNCYDRSCAKNKITPKNCTSCSSAHLTKRSLPAICRPTTHFQPCSRSCFPPPPTPELEGSLPLRNQRSWEHRLWHRCQVHLLACIMFNPTGHYNSQNTPDTVMWPQVKAGSQFHPSSLLHHYGASPVSHLRN